MRNAQIRRLKAVLNFGIKRGYLDANPINRLEFADIDKDEVEVFHVETVERILRDALENDRSILPFMVL